MKGIRRLALVLALAVGSVAATAALVPMAAGAAVDPCSLVTTADLEAATGIAFIQFARPDTSASTCEFVIADSTTQDAFVSVSVSQYKSKKLAKQNFKGLQAAQPETTEAVKGIGKAAFYSPTLGDDVVFRKGKTVVTIGLEILAENPAPHRDEAIAIAEAAAANL